MSSLQHRIITGSILVGLCTIAWSVPTIFHILWLSISLWILTVEWPRLAPWYTGVAYPGLLLAFVWYMSWYATYRYLIWIALASAIIFDTGAYIVGRSGGHHYIAPHISPRKTWEGTISGLILLYLAVYIYIDLHHISVSTDDHLLYILATCILSTAAFTGDLFVSWMKRKANIKDCSSILPGHGGLLDRCDSMLFCVPVIYLFHVVGIV